MGFENVIGYESVKEELCRVVDMVKSPDKYERLGAYVPRGIMLYGKPGCGKTLIAGSFIEECGIPAFICRKNKADDEFVDEICKTFAEAKAVPKAIVFVDDICSWANEDMDHRDAEDYICLKTCIDECAGSNILVLATCNDIEKLPESLLRSGRFDIVCEIEAPKLKDAEKIIRHYLATKSYVESDVDVEELAVLLQGRSCADLGNILNQAGIYAGFANRDKINNEDIVKAVLRVLFEEKNGEHYSPELLKRVAVHEAGHCLVNELLEPGSVKIVSCRKARSSHGGLTCSLRKEEFAMDSELRENAICVSLAGKAATEVLLGDVDLGCAEDIEMARGMLETLLFEVCAKDFSVISDSLFGIAPNIRDSLLHAELGSYYNKTKKLLHNNRNKLAALTEALIKRETLTAKELAEILQNT